MNDAPSTLPKSLVETLPSSVGIAKSVNLMLVALDTLARELKGQERRGAIALARSFVVLHRLKDKFDDLDKAFSALFEDYKSNILPEMLDDENLPHVPLSEGFRVGISHAWRASIKKGMREEAYQWLTDNGLSNLITDTVNSSSLAAAAKYEAEENNIDFPEKLFSVARIPTTSVTRTK